MSNVTLPGTGAVIATDDISGVEYQLVKLIGGAAGNTTPVDATANGLKVDGSAVTQPVSGTFWQSTQPVSAASLPLPSGAATSAKQPALGTAGTASSDVLTVQGITSMTALKVDGSAVTQPVSGTVTVQQSTASSLKVDLSGTAANTTAIKVDGSAVTQPVSLASVPTHAVTQSGTWTVQPGNTANTTAWKVDGSSVTQPVSGTVSATLTSTTNAGATAKTSDYDTGAGTDTLTMFGVALPASGGAVAGGTSTNPLRTDPTGSTTQPVSGTVTANAGTGTMAVSAASLPLPSGASTSAKQPALGTAGSASADVITVQGVASMTALKVDGSAVTQPVSGTFWQATQPVSAASLPLPSGASTSAKQPALGTAGTAASDVITVQGIASMTALKVDGSAVTQPVSGTVTANATQSGTWTVQPGNTANTTAWKVDGSAVTQPVSGTVTVQQSTASSLKVDLSGTAANATAIKVDGSAVTQPVSGTVSAQASAATATTGSITANAQSIPAAVAGYSHVGVSINGTYAGVNIAFEFSDDGGTTYYAMQMTRSDSSVVETTSGALTNTSRAWDATVPSCTHFRVRSTAFTSGSAAIRIIPSAFPAVYNVTGNFRVTDTTATNFLPTMDAAARRGFMTVTDGTNSMPTGDAVARAVFQKVTDGTNTSAVKAASTAPVATDPALVVSVSPNTPTLLVQTVPGTANGWSASSQTALSNTKTQVKSSAGLFGGYMLYNPNATVTYIQVWDVALASVTVGTTAPTYVIPLPGTAGANLEIRNGITHGTAIVIAATTTPTGSTAPGTAIVGFILNK